jgi:hypothetical protein
MGNGETPLRRRFYGKELTNYANSIASEVESRCQQIDTVFHSADQTLRESRQLDDIFDRMLLERNKQQKKDVSGFHDMHVDLDDDNDDYSHLASSSSNITMHGKQEKIVTVSEQAWLQICKTAFDRLAGGEEDCAICMSTINSTSRMRRPLVILSCSHVFHAQCVKNFDLFCQNVHQTSFSHNNFCPICRLVNPDRNPFQSFT